MKQPIKMTPGDDLHLSLLMAPHSLNLAVGQLREQLFGYGRAAFEAGKAGQCLHQIQEPTEYPSLPSSTADVVDFMNGRLEVDFGDPLPAGGTSLYSADQMRAYVDADRAQRAAPVQAAPAVAPVLPEPDAMEFQGNDGEWHGFVDARHKQATVESGKWPIRNLYSEGSVRALLATATGLPAQAVLDHPWRDHLLDGRTLVRDESGFAEHPELPMLDEGMKPRAFFAALGVEMKHTMAEDDLTMDEYDALNDAENWSPWAPRPPSGEAWNLVAIFDTEDGPAAWWARAQKESREAAPQAQADARDAEIQREALPDPHGCNACKHPDCGKFNGPRSVECRAMAINACA